MDYRSHRRPRSSRLAPYRHALDHIEAFLDLTGDDDEDAKMKRVMILMFGEPPLVDVTRLQLEAHEKATREAR